MTFYGVKAFVFVQFDYYGDSLFMVSIFEENAIECVYPQSDPGVFFEMEDCKSKEEEGFMIKRGSIQYEKSVAIFLFSTLKNISEFFEIKMKDSYFDGNNKKLVSK